MTVIFLGSNHLLISKNVLKIFFLNTVIFSKKKLAESDGTLNTCTDISFAMGTFGGTF